MSSPNAGIPYVPTNTLDPAAGLNDAIDVLDVLVQTAVIAMDLDAPPGTSADGDMYVVGDTPSGVWAGKANWVARFVLEGHFWKFYEPGVQVHYLLDHNTGEFFKWDQTVSPPKWQQLTLSDATLSVSDDESPPTIVTPVTDIILGSGLTLTDLGGGVIRIQSSGGGGGSGAQGANPADIPTSPDAWDDEFEGGTVDAAWNWINQSGASVSQSEGALKLVGSIASSSTNHNLLVKTAPSAPYDIVSRIALAHCVNNGDIAVALYNSGNSHCLMVGLVFTASTMALFGQRCTAPATFDSNVLLPVTAPALLGLGTNSPFFYLRVTNDGTTLRFLVSVTGHDTTWTQIYTETIAAFLGAVTDLGFAMNSVSTSVPAEGLVDFTRRIA